MQIQLRKQKNEELIKWPLLPQNEASNLCNIPIIPQRENSCFKYKT